MEEGHRPDVIRWVITLAILIGFLLGIFLSFVAGVAPLGHVFRRLREWDTPWGRVLRAPVGVIAFAVALTLIVGLMALLAVLLDRGLGKYW